MWKNVRLAHICVAIVAAVMVGCGAPSSPSPTGPATTTFQGTIAGVGGQKGTLDITINGTVTASVRSFYAPFVATLHAQGINAAGTLRVSGGTTTALTGTYESGPRTVNLSGSGVTLNGTLNGGVLSGSYTGAMSGGFSTISGANGAVTRFCGTYTTTTPNYKESGTWNIQAAANGTVSGVHAAVTPVAECCGFVTGRQQGNTITFTTEEGKTVTGTVQGGTLSGSHPNGGGTTSFSGTTDACQ